MAYHVKKKARVEERQSLSYNWQAGCSGIGERAAALLNVQQWTDCEFAVGSSRERIKAHRLLLASASPVFAAMFFGSLSEKKYPIAVTDVEPEVFKEMLRYIVTDQANITSIPFACELHYTAKKYMMPHLMQLCSYCLYKHVEPRTVCFLLEYASLVQEDALLKRCMQVIEEQTSEVLKCNTIEDATMETMMTIFSMEQLGIDSELELFKAAEKYARAQHKKTREPSQVIDITEDIVAPRTAVIRQKPDIWPDVLRSMQYDADKMETVSPKGLKTGEKEITKKLLAQEQSKGEDYIKSDEIQTRYETISDSEDSPGISDEKPHLNPLKRRAPPPRKRIRTIGPDHSKNKTASKALTINPDTQKNKDSNAIVADILTIEDIVPILTSDEFLNTLMSTYELDVKNIPNLGKGTDGILIPEDSSGFTAIPKISVVELSKLQTLKKDQISFSIERILDNEPSGAKRPNKKSDNIEEPIITIKDEVPDTSAHKTSNIVESSPKKEPDYKTSVCTLKGLALRACLPDDKKIDSSLNSNSKLLASSEPEHNPSTSEGPNDIQNKVTESRIRVESSFKSRTPGKSDCVPTVVESLESNTPGDKNIEQRTPKESNQEPRSPSKLEVEPTPAVESMELNTLGESNHLPTTPGESRIELRPTGDSNLEPQILDISGGELNIEQKSPGGLNIEPGTPGGSDNEPKTNAVASLAPKELNNESRTPGEIDIKPKTTLYLNRESILVGESNNEHGEPKTETKTALNSELYTFKEPSPQQNISGNIDSKSQSTFKYIYPKPSTSKDLNIQSSTVNDSNHQPSTTSRNLTPPPSTNPQFTAIDYSNLLPSTSKDANPQPSTSKHLDPQLSTSINYSNPQPGTSKDSNPEHSTLIDYSSPQPGTSKDSNHKLSASIDYSNPQPSTSKSSNQPSTSTDYLNPQPSTSKEFNDQSSTSEDQNNKPSTFIDFSNPQPSTSKESKKRRLSRRNSRIKEKPQVIELVDSDSDADAATVPVGHSLLLGNQTPRVPKKVRTPPWIGGPKQDSPIRPLVHFIRFLAVSPQEFAECTTLHTLLSGGEIYSIMMNICSRYTHVPMPKGFSTSRVQRTRVQKCTSTLRISNMTTDMRRTRVVQLVTINSFSGLESFHSAPFYLMNLPWRLVARPEYVHVNSNYKVKYLSLFVECNWESSKAWQCSAQVELRVVPAGSGSESQYHPFIEPIAHEFTATFRNDRPIRGYSTFAQWDDISRLGFLKHDVLTVVVTIARHDPALAPPAPVGDNVSLFSSLGHHGYESTESNQPLNLTDTQTAVFRRRLIDLLKL